MTDTGRVTLEVTESVATVCLDRPAKHNALTPEMLGQLEQILIDLAQSTGDDFGQAGARDLAAFREQRRGDRSGCSAA